MANTQIIIDATDINNQPVKKTITDINPEASNAQLATFGTMLNALTDNVYEKTTKITKTNCDDETSKAVPTVTFTDDDYTKPVSSISFKIPSTQSGTVSFYVHYTGDAKPLISIPECHIFFALMDDKEHRDNWFAVDVRSLGSGVPFTPGKYDVEFYFPETDNYQAVSATILLDAEE